MTKHFLYLTNDKLIALIWRSGAIVEREVFASQDAEGPAFSAWLRRHAQVPAWIITDLIEEDFRVDTMPHVRGADRDAVLERKLGQLYRGSPFRHAIVQGREEAGRKDDRVLFHALTNPELLNPFINALANAEIALQGVSSSAVLSAILPETLDTFFPHTLLVTIVPDFGLRQTYFRDKQIKFSRLTPIIYEEGKSVGDSIAAEASRTWQYLDSLRYFAGSEESLEVCIVVHAKDRDTIAEAIRAYPLFKYRFLDIGEIAEQIKLKPAPASSHAEEMLVHLYAQKGAENHFAGKESLRFAKYRRMRFGLYAATAALLAIGIGVTAFNLQQASLISAETDKRDLSARGAQSEFQNISNLIRGQISATAAMRDTSLFFRAQANPSTPAPGAILRQVAAAWADFPDLRMDQFVWQPHHDGTLALSQQRPAAALPSNIRAESKTAAAPGAVAAPGAGTSVDTDVPLAGTRFEVAAIDGAVTGFRGDYRKANERVAGLIARLNREKGYQVSALEMPLDTKPAARLRGKAAELDAPEARFSLRIVVNREAK